MEARYTRQLRSLERCQRFLSTNPEAVGTLADSGSSRMLDQAISDTRAAANAQASRRRELTGAVAVVKAAKRRVRDALLPVVSVARSHAGDVPELTSVGMPAFSDSALQHVEAARSMSHAVEPQAGLFVSAGLRPDFLDEIERRAAVLQEAHVNKEAVRTQRANATAGVRQAVERGRRAVDQLHALLVPQLRDTPFLAEWLAAKRVESKPGPVPGTVIRVPSAGL